METPKDINGVRTEAIMQNINKKMFSNKLPVGEYNEMYMVIYNTLKKISIKNIHRCMQEIDVKLFDIDFDSDFPV